MAVLQLVLNRLLYGVLVIVSVALLISSLIFMGQVDPARLTFGQQADAASIEAKREALGLNKPLYQQLLSYLGDISPVQYLSKASLGNKAYRDSHTKLFQTNTHAAIVKFPYLGKSYQSGRTVIELIRNAFPLTLLLALSSFSIALLFGLLMGIISAIKYETWIDKLILAISSVGFSLPSYVVAMITALIFAYYLQAYTGLELQGSIFELDELGNDIVVWKNLLLPSIALGVRPLAIITQITRSTMLDTLQAPFMKTARAKGLSFRQALMKHAFPNTLNPIGTAVSGWFASLLAGAFFVETVFNFKGLGNLTVQALLSYDLPVMLGCILFTSCLFVGINIATDLFYQLIDPRTRK